MSNDIASAKQRLPLPALMKKLGLSDHAKKSARCPLHTDKHNSFSVWQRQDGLHRFKCHAGCGEGDEIIFLELREKLSRRDAIKRFLSLAGLNDATPPRSTTTFDWQKCVDAFSAKHLERLSEWRGYPGEFCSELKASGLVGIVEGCIALPLHDRAGKVIAAHVRVKDGTWRYSPTGTKTRPLVIGELVAGDPVHIFESQWDAFAFMAVSGERSGIIITRGASNGGLIAGVIPQAATVHVWPQNDRQHLPEEKWPTVNGIKIPSSEKWEKDVCSHTKCAVKSVKTPAQFADLNDWVRGGGTDKDLLNAIVNAEVLREPEVTVTGSQGEETGDELTSLTSFDLTPYPAPLSQAAFHGMAGRFVERVFPYTEADRAALLFSFLVAFGNVIGRTAYAIADGARHYCNLNAVLVGPTGKARKGSARWHTNRLFGCVDQEWIENCIVSGLSSGEGLITAVQDEVTKTVKNKKSGEYETQIVEPGKKDKRLLVIQTEFATALKVMEREGNTLSSVIRSAWDCEPKLRTLTKNSSTCATDPHISIIGHITAEELRPGLNEIEAANGFGNRFLWVPVKRSKELPEGGELPPISDLIEPLQNAVASAKKHGGALKRDEAGREFWASIYHDLSAGQPGLFGAITARSEAQCLRLSDIYALLDCAPLVGVEHLEAALAAWRYCENGARWSFRTGTGNKNADRILAALAAVRQKGLTKRQIIIEVFNRNATKFEIDEALRTLHQLKLAACVIEKTGGRPAEHWFYSAIDYELNEQSRSKRVDQADSSFSSYPPASETGDTSYSSSTQHSKNASSAEPDTVTETPIGDESGVVRL